MNDPESWLRETLRKTRVLPGIMTPSEALAAREHWYGLLELFPAEPAGGRGLLLALPNVVCVGGSWVAPPTAVAGGDWPRITRLAVEVHR